MAHDIPSSTTQPTISPLTEARAIPSMSEGEAYKYDPKYHKMSDFLGVQEHEKYETDVANKIAYIRDFTGEKNEIDAMVKIKKIIRKLGVQVKGKELITTLYRYTRLLQDKQSIDKEITLLK